VSLARRFNARLRSKVAAATEEVVAFNFLSNTINAELSSIAASAAEGARGVVALFFRTPASRSGADSTHGQAEVCPNIGCSDLTEKQRQPSILDVTALVFWRY
jgi:hypothetical protein